MPGQPAVLRRRGHNDGRAPAPAGRSPRRGRLAALRRACSHLPAAGGYAVLTGGAFSYLGRRFTVPLPYMALRFVPVLNGVRVPGRFAIMAILALDILAATALASFSRHRPRWALGAWAAALVVTLKPGYDDPPAFGAGDLRRLGIGYVVYHRDRPWPAAYSYLAGLGLPVLADDGTVVAWKVPAAG